MLLVTLLPGSVVGDMVEKKRLHAGGVGVGEACGTCVETRALERIRIVMTVSLPETTRSRVTKRLSRISGLETAEALGQCDIMA